MKTAPAGYEWRQAWAGAKWGAIHIPRIGQEVIVDFLEGDPDSPIITGRVYNDDNMPPYDLPDGGGDLNATQSGIKSSKLQGGKSDQHKRVEVRGQKGEELIFIQAEKDQEIRVKNDLVELVGHEDHLTVKSDQLQMIEGDKHLTVTGDRNEKVDGTISRQAGIDMQERVGNRHALDAGTEIYLKAGLNIVLEAGMSITLKAGGGFIVVGPTGVAISGVPVLINSGGAPVPGSGCSPQSPKEPREPASHRPLRRRPFPLLLPSHRQSLIHLNQRQLRAFHLLVSKIGFIMSQEMEKITAQIWQSADSDPSLQLYAILDAARDTRIHSRLAESGIGSGFPFSRRPGCGTGRRRSHILSRFTVKIASSTGFSPTDGGTVGES